MKKIKLLQLRISTIALIVSFLSIENTLIANHESITPETSENKFEAYSLERFLEKEMGDEFHPLIDLLSTSLGAKDDSNEGSNLTDTELNELVPSPLNPNLKKKLQHPKIAKKHRLYMLKDLDDHESKSPKLRKYRFHLRKIVQSEILNHPHSRLVTIEKELLTLVNNLKKVLNPYLDSESNFTECSSLFESSIDQFLICRALYEKKVELEYENFLLRLKEVNHEFTIQAFLSQIAHHIMSKTPHSENMELSFILTKNKEIFYVLIPKEKASLPVFSPAFIALKESFKTKSISSSLVDKIASTKELSLLDRESFNITIGKSSSSLIVIKAKSFPSLERTLDSLKFSRLEWDEDNPFKDTPECFKLKSSTPSGINNLRKTPHLLRWYLAAAHLIAANIHPRLLGIKNGHAIVSLLVLNNGRVAGIGINTIGHSQNCRHKHMTQHAEINLVEAYFSKHPDRKELPKNSTVITTLQPCSMCASMLYSVRNLKTKGSFVLYGQKDPTQNTILTEKGLEKASDGKDFPPLKIKNSFTSPYKSLFKVLNETSKKIKKEKGLNTASSTKEDNFQRILKKILFAIKKQYKKGIEQGLEKYINIFEMFEVYLSKFYIDLNLPEVEDEEAY